MPSVYDHNHKIDLEDRKSTNLPFKAFDIFPQILGLVRNKAMLYYNVRKPFWILADLSDTKYWFFYIFFKPNSLNTIPERCNCVSSYQVLIFSHKYMHFPNFFQQKHFLVSSKFNIKRSNLIGQRSRQKLTECFPLILHTSKVDILFNFALKCQVQQNITIPM